MMTDDDRIELERRAFESVFGPVFEDWMTAAREQSYERHRRRSRSRYHRLRQYASDHHWPYWILVALARPGEYAVARQIWGWPRRHALGVTLATWCGRRYRRNRR